MFEEKYNFLNEILDVKIHQLLKTKKIKEEYAGILFFVDDLRSIIKVKLISEINKDDLLINDDVFNNNLLKRLMSIELDFSLFQKDGLVKLLKSKNFSKESCDEITEYLDGISEDTLNRFLFNVYYAYNLRKIRSFAENIFGYSHSVTIDLIFMMTAIMTLKSYENLIEDKSANLNNYDFKDVLNCLHVIYNQEKLDLIVARKDIPIWFSDCILVNCGDENKVNRVVNQLELKWKEGLK